MNWYALIPLLILFSIMARLLKMDSAVVDWSMKLAILIIAIQLARLSSYAVQA
jgi:hypothetical protein